MYSISSLRKISALKKIPIKYKFFREAQARGVLIGGSDLHPTVRELSSEGSSRELEGASEAPKENKDN